VLEQILARDEQKLYEDKLHNIKNLIYKNIYNNLSYINKSKGTEKAFRNLFRCFGIDDDLFRLNLYGDNVEYELTGTYESVTTKKKVMNFTGFNNKSDDRAAVVYQYPSSSSDYGFISASSDLYIPFSVEAEVIFPKLLTTSYTGSADLELLTSASLFGCHSSTASADDEDSLFGSPDRDFQVEAVKVDNGERVYFRLKSSTEFFEEIKTTTYPQDGASSAKVYDNSKWNFAVRVRPDNYPISSNVITSSGFSLEFYGINNYLGEVLDEFSLSTSITTEKAGDFITGSNKRFFVGAHRDGFTGSILQKSDVRLSSLRVWHDYISDEEMRHHARDPNNFGRLNPGRTVTTASAEAGLSSSIHIPQAEALALNWDFETTPTADSSGEFLIRDVASGSYPAYRTKEFSGLTTTYSALVSHSYGAFAAHTKTNHTAKGYGFTANKSPTNFEFIPTTRQLQPENLYSSDLVNILSTDDLFFTRESRPVKHFFSIEASMYEIISRRMLNFFASIIDFNNQIGEPVNRFRGKYKGLEKLRHMFFDKIEEVSDIEKFVELYKWLDNALDTAVSNLIPASANASKEVRTIVENHILSRNKYQHRPPLFVDVPNFGSPGNTGPDEPIWVDVSEDYPDEIEDVDPETAKLVTKYKAPPKPKPPPPPPVLGCKSLSEAICKKAPELHGKDGKTADNYLTTLTGKKVTKHQDGSCVWKGCGDKLAINFDNCTSPDYADNSKCKYTYGCIDKCAKNYSPKYKGYGEECKGGKCCKYVKGCHDASATNHWFKNKTVKDKLDKLAAGPDKCAATKDNSLCEYEGKTGCCDDKAFNSCKEDKTWNKFKQLPAGECSACDKSKCSYYACKKKLNQSEKDLGLEILNPADPKLKTEACVKAGKTEHYCCQIAGCKAGKSMSKDDKDCINCTSIATHHNPYKCKYKCCYDDTAGNYKEYVYGNFPWVVDLCDPSTQYNKEVCRYNYVCKSDFHRHKQDGYTIKIPSSNYGKLTQGPNAGQNPPADEPALADNDGCTFPACTVAAAESFGKGAAAYALNLIISNDSRVVDAPEKCRFKCCLNTADSANYGFAAMGQYYFGWQCIKHTDKSCETCRSRDDTVKTICNDSIKKAGDCDPVTGSPLLCENCHKCSNVADEPMDKCTNINDPPCCDPKIDCGGGGGR